MSLLTRLRKARPFNTIPEELFRRIAGAAKAESYAAGSWIFHQSDRPTGFLYVIDEGLVEITVLSPAGDDMVVDYRRPGNFFGGTPIFTGEGYTGGARAARATTCFLIPEAILHEAARSCPELGNYFTRIVLSRVRTLYAEIVSDHARSAPAQIEAYPFRKRLSEIMSSPVETVPPTASAREVARRLAEREIGAVVVVDAQQRPLGLISERDLVTRVILPAGTDPDRLCAADLMSTAPPPLTPETYMYEAMTHMQGLRLKYLLVVEGERLVGIVTLRDLMRYRSQKAMLLLGNIRREATLTGLAAIRLETVTLARALLHDGRGTPEVMEILSYIHHALIRRTFELTLTELAAAGKTPPDIRWSFLLMGSGGRREMLLAPDQDHGFIYEDVPDERMPEVEAFFAPFAARLVTALATVGYPLCHGQVMASNPAWRGRLCDWQHRIQDWINNPEPQKVRYSSIFFDFTPLVGDPGLANDLRATVMREIREFQSFLYHMMALDLRYKVPLGLLGRFLVDRSGPHRGEISLKQGGSVYIVDCIRMFALEREITALTTLDRLKELTALNVFAPETAEHIRAAFEALSFLRLRNDIERLDRGEEPDHHLNPKLLSKNEQDLLREALSAVSKLQDATKRHFGRTAF